MKLKFSLVIFSLLIILNGCTIETSKTNNISTSLSDPKKVVENYYKYKNEKNKEGLLKTITKGYQSHNSSLGLDVIEYIKLININEETDTTFRKGYLGNSGKVHGIDKEENVKVYRVEYDIKYKEGAIVAEESGKHTWWLFVVRKDKDSAWLIDEIGQP